MPINRSCETKEKRPALVTGELSDNWKRGVADGSTGKIKFAHEGVRSKCVEI